MAIAEILIGAFITVLFEKLASSDLIRLARSKGVHSQLNKWKNTLLQIQAVLADAGQKHITERAVQMWLINLQDLAYDMDDVLDGLATEALRAKLNHVGTDTGKILKIIPSCCFTPSNLMYSSKMSSKINEITIKLHDLVDEKNNLGLDVNVNVKVERSNRRLEETSLVDESRIMGRERDKETLMVKLLGKGTCNQNFSIVSIVGLGGIGKTTLAKVLYNEAKVKDHFELRAWVCVSEEFDVFNISKVIFQAVDGENKDFANLVLLHVALKEKLSKKRFLLVLDDVWSEDYKEWELLQNPFVVGAPGSKVIVTTRKTNVAYMMNSFQPYDLEILSNENALSLFAQNALNENNFVKHPTLELLAKGIVKKCGGLPLALTTLGRTLKTKNYEGDWEDLLNSEIWNLHDEKEILPALKLSYYDLPPHLKQLFAYCSLFPKNYVYDKNELVLLWMAEGFLSQTKGNKSSESLGSHYFEELKSRSFFQHSTNDESRYTMHDLINDLAMSVAGDFFCMLDDKVDQKEKNESFEKFRHFSFISQRHGVYRKLRELQRARHLRTFLQVSIRFQMSNLLDNVLVELLPQLQFLRVLSLSNFSITEVPQSIGSLKHMRYLNFSKTNIKQLPEQISGLYNLQTLLVQGCRELCSLSFSFAKLINMRHLDISGTPLLKETPPGIGGLTNLQTLCKVYIEGSNGFKVSELNGLRHLHGELSIKGLDKVMDPIQAKDANLQQKKGLDELDMEWSEVFDDSRNPVIEYQVLERLRPHPTLRKLKILFYGGIEFPSWVGDPSFGHLTDLTLHGCRSCKYLTTLGHLNSLQKLFVRSMKEVKTIGFELLTPTKYFQGIAFPSLEVLKFYDMQGWERWSTSGANIDETARVFPRLHKISIRWCPKLAEVSVGLIPSLRVLHIEGCSERVLGTLVSVSSLIRRLTVSNIKNLDHMHEETIKHLGEVEELSISLCDDFRYLWESESEAYKYLVGLQKLKIIGCKKLVSLGEKEVKLGIREVLFNDCDTLESYNCPNSVERLMINFCSSVTSLTFSTLSELNIHDIPAKGCETVRWFPQKDYDNIESLPDSCFGFLPHLCLRSLEICYCRNLKSFPHEHLQSLLSLEELIVRDCPSLDYSFPGGLWPPNLRVLRIGCLNKPMSEWGMQNYPTSLVDLHLYGKNSGVVSFALEEDAGNTTSSNFLLPPSLTSLSIKDFMVQEESLSEVLQRLTRLEHFNIS